MGGGSVLTAETGQGTDSRIACFSLRPGSPVVCVCLGALITGAESPEAGHVLCPSRHLASTEAECQHHPHTPGLSSLSLFCSPCAFIKCRRMQARTRTVFIHLCSLCGPRRNLSLWSSPPSPWCPRHVPCAHTQPQHPSSGFRRPGAAQSLFL